MMQYDIEQHLPIQVKIINPLIHNFGLPSYAHPGDAGCDLRACIEIPTAIHSGETLAIPTGIAIFIKNPNIAGFIDSRSGLSLNNAIVVAQGRGVIDSQYTGELKVILHNQGDGKYIITPGEKIAQLIFQPVLHMSFRIVNEFTEETIRGSSGFGSSGR